MAEDEEGDIQNINPIIAKTVGLFGKKEEMKIEYSLKVTQQTENQRIETTTVTPFNIKDKEVSKRTGFKSVSNLISFIIIACNGDISTMEQTVSNITWFEEFFLLFEVIGGKVHYDGGMLHRDTKNRKKSEIYI
jgi:hypothetical protein